MNANVIKKIVIGLTFSRPIFMKLSSNVKISLCGRLQIKLQSLYTLQNIRMHVCMIHGD